MTTYQPPGPALRLLLDFYAGGLDLDTPLEYFRTPETRAAVSSHREEMRELAARYPRAGFACRGGCGRRSILTPEREAYRCWACGP